MRASRKGCGWGHKDNYTRHILGKDKGSAEPADGVGLGIKKRTELCTIVLGR